MEEIQNFTKTHPRRAIVAGGGTSIFLIVVLMMGLYVAFDGKIPITLQAPVSTPVNTTSYPQQNQEVVSYTNQNADEENIDTTTNTQVPTINTDIYNPDANTHSGYVSAPVAEATCVTGETKFMNDYYSFCYPNTYSISEGQQGNSSGDTFLRLTATDGKEFYLERVNANNSMSRLQGINDYYKSTDFIANVLKEADNSTASQMGYLVIGQDSKHRLNSYSYTYTGTKINTFLSVVDNNQPSTERSQLYFRNGDSDYLFNYISSQDTLRIIESLEFSK